MPFQILLGLGRSSGEKVEQEEATRTPSLHSLLKKLSLPPRRVLWMLPLLMLKRVSLSKKGTLRSSLAEVEERRNSSSLTLTPSNKAMRLLVTYLSKEGKELERKSMEGEVQS